MRTVADVGSRLFNAIRHAGKVATANRKQDTKPVQWALRADSFASHAATLRRHAGAE